MPWWWSASRPMIPATIDEKPLPTGKRAPLIQPPSNIPFPAVLCNTIERNGALPLAYNARLRQTFDSESSSSMDYGHRLDEMRMREYDSAVTGQVETFCSFD